MICYDIYLLTAIGLSPCGSTHLHTNNTENNTNNNRTTQITNNVEGCGSCPVFVSVTLAFALQLMKKHGKTSVRLINTSVKSRIYLKILSAIMSTCNNFYTEEPRMLGTTARNLVFRDLCAFGMML
jgi:uncharacterized protein YceK